MEKDHRGDQINQKVDIIKVGNDFINYFYNNWLNDPSALVNTVIKNHTRLKFSNCVYQGEDLLKFLILTKEKGISFQIANVEIMDSGARRADILVTGKVRESHNTNELLNYCQYFTIANIKDGWFIHNSLLSIF